MLRLKFLGFKAEPTAPEFGVNTYTISQLEQNLINTITNTFGANNLQTPIKYTDFSKNNPETRVIDVIADIAEAIRFCLAGIEDNNIYVDIPHYFGKHYDSEDKKSSEYKNAIASYSILKLSLLLHTHFVKNQNRMSFNFTQVYTQLLEIINNYSGLMNLGAYKLEETLEA